MSQYQDGDLVYINPAKKEIVGKVQWEKEGIPKLIEWEDDRKDEDGKPRKRLKKRYYPWGTYHSMKSLYKVEGKKEDDGEYIPLEEAIVKLQEEPFWD